MSTPPPRAWRAACPNCGAAVDFASAASPVAVCSFCRSTLARDGQTLRRIGVSAELFDDHSPLQLGVAGRHQGAAFQLVGRLQMRSADAAWNEWHALFDGGKSGWLSEDNGRHVLAFDAALPADAPRDPSSLRPGQRLAVGGRGWTVASVLPARVAAAEGELPFAPNLAAEFAVADLRSAEDEVATLDYSDAAQPLWSIGRPVALAELALSGLRDAGEKRLDARGLACPNCGAAVSLQFDGTRSVVCPQCSAVIDVSAGVGGDLAHFVQSGVREPQIALGTLGTLALGGAAQRWQVVGYVERCEMPDDPDDERVFWREYLLHHAGEGFAFVVDAEDGWSWAVTITGTPEGSGERVRWRGRNYRRRYPDYSSETTYVLGEFYWQVERGQRTRHSDYADGAGRLNREQAAAEINWSAGETLAADAVAKAFALPEAQRAALARDAAPVSGGGWSLRSFVIIAVVVAAMIFALRACSRDDCDELRATFGESSNEYQQCRRSGAGAARFRSGGGSYGGFGSGGGHK